MVKIILQYDEASGALTDAKGDYIASYIGAKSFEPETESIKPADLVDLAKAGFSAEALLEMKKKGLL